jgi:O-antigen ligase
VLAAALAPLALLPLLIAPVLAVAAAITALAVAAAWHSPAIPIALAGMPAVAFAVLGSNPLPEGAVTAGVGAWVALAVALAIARRDDLVVRALVSLPVLATVALLGWMMFRLGDSTAAGYGTVKLQLFALGNVLLLAGGAVVGLRRADFRLLIGLTLAVATAGSLVVALGIVSGEAATINPGRLAVSPSEDPISLGRDSATAIMIAIYFIIASHAPAVRVAALAALPVTAVALLAAGSRGPVLGAVAGIAVLLSLTATDRRSRQRLLLVAAAGLVSLSLVSAIVPDAAFSRALSILTLGGDGMSSNGRVYLWELAVAAFESYPVAGIGTGSFASVPIGESYPHNLFLEAAAEFGLVGLALVVVFVLSTLARLPRLLRDGREAGMHDVALLAALLTAALVNALFSGGMPSNEHAWLWAGVVVGFSVRYARQRLPLPDLQ